MANDFEKINIKHASLFTGIGGFDLASQWMGWQNIFQCEKDDWCKRVLAKNFPTVKRYGDITQESFTNWLHQITILTGGFPCQPFSIAGAERGKDDERYLWHEMLRAINEIKPPYIVAENVPGLLTNSGGMVFKQVCADLEFEGYEVQPVIIPAAGKNAIHKRERVWIIAYSDNATAEHAIQAGWNLPTSMDENVYSNSNGSGQQECRTERRTPGQLTSSFSGEIETAICGADDGLSGWVDRIRGLGNAIVPQVAFEIFCGIEFCIKEGRKKKV